MQRAISLAILVVLVVLLAILFYQVMIGFLLPLFLATLLAILFQPLHRQIVQLFRGYTHLAAGATTVVILLIVLAPLAFILLRAATEATAILSRERSAAPTSLTTDSAPVAVPSLTAHSNTTQRTAAQAASGIQPGAATAKWHFNRQTLDNIVKNVNDRFSLHISSEELVQVASTKAQEWFGPLATKTPGFLGSLLINCFVTVLALFYFLADGKQLTASAMRLLPLDQKYQEQLVGKFVEMSRAVTSASLLAALTQGVLLGCAYYFAGLGGVFLLTILTMFASFVPLIGSFVVWGSCCVWLFFADRPTAAILLFVWSITVAVAADNVVKPLVLHGQSKLHPLLALLSVLGGVQVLGPLGIFFGPMAVAFLQAGLTMLNIELNALQSDGAPLAATGESLGYDSRVGRGRHRKTKK